MLTHNKHKFIEVSFSHIRQGLGCYTKEVMHLFHVPPEGQLFFAVVNTTRSELMSVSSSCFTVKTTLLFSCE